VAKRRLALLIGSTEGIVPEMTKIKTATVDNALWSMEGLLKQPAHGPFEVRRLRTPSRPSVLGYLDEASKDCRNDEVTLLIYYFGHGFIGTKGRLILAYRNVDAGNSEPFELDALVVECRQYGFKRVILILDCCHAGVAQRSIEVSAPNVQYYLMAAASSDYAYFSETGGDFTRALVEALQGATLDPDLRNKVLDAITFDTWFKVASKTPLRSEPISSGSLGNEIVRPFKQIVTPAFSLLAPTKSLYVKMFKMLAYLVDRSLHGADQILKQIKIGKDPSFRLIYPGDKTLRFVSPERIGEYLEILSHYGLAQRTKEKWTATKAGETAVRANGDRFNLVLTQAIFAYLLTNMIEKDALSKIISELTSKFIVPNVLNIERMLLGVGVSVSSRKGLRTALNILSYAGVYQRATPDTYFPV
jgi:hypothetical protein